VQQPHVDQDSGGVVLDVLGILCTVVGIVPLVRGQQKLHQHIRNVGIVQSLVMVRVQGDGSQGLQQKTQQVLEKSVALKHELPIRPAKSCLSYFDIFSTFPVGSCTLTHFPYCEFLIINLYVYIHYFPE
jgi:hypothetical protein